MTREEGSERGQPELTSGSELAGLLDGDGSLADGEVVTGAGDGVDTSVGDGGVGERGREGGGGKKGEDGEVLHGW